MNQKELRDLIEFIVEKDLTEFEYERGDVKVRVKRGAVAQITQVAAPLAPLAPIAVAPVTTAAPVAGPAVQPAAAEGAAAAIAGGNKAAASEEGLHMVTSPIVGTFYEAPSPGSPPFVKPGDEVTAGQVLCIIEAMKLMNEIESDVAGEIVKRLVNNGEPVEYGQRLFAVRPRS